MLDPKWFEKINVSALGQEIRRGILGLVKDKLGFTNACRALGIAKSSMHRYLSGKREIPGELVKKALRYVEEKELEKLLSGWDKLRALGIVGEDGVVDYELALNILALASRDEYLKNALLRFVVREFKG